MHSLGLVSLYNGCYLYEGQFVNSTCSFNKNVLLKKKKTIQRDLALSGFTEGREMGANSEGPWEEEDECIWSVTGFFKYLEE